MTSIVQLGETRGSAVQRLALDASVRVATTPLEAASLLAAGRPDAIVLDSDVGWACDLVEGLEPRARPAVVVVGERGPATVGLADQWLPREATAPTARQRLQRAVGRATCRNVHPGAGYIDAATGLPNRRAVLRALVRRAEKARRSRGAISLVFVSLVAVEPGSPQERASLTHIGEALQRHVRRTEVGGRLARRRFALVIQGGRRVAIRVAARMEALFASKGIEISSAAVEVNLAKPALALLQKQLRRRDRAAAAPPFRAPAVWCPAPVGG